MAQAEPPCVSVVIVNFNTASLLCDCLASLYGATGATTLEVIVVENASTDGSAAAVRERFPDVHLIANATNLGFGAANNQGVAVARGQYVLLLNSDTVVCQGAIERLVAELEHHPSVGVVGPKLIGVDGKRQRSTFRFPTPGVLFLEESSLAQRYAGMDRRLREEQHADTPVSVDWLLGACIIGRQSLLRDLGPFDPDFFMYAEDIDLCYRARQRGWDLYFVPDATVVHLGGMSTRRDRTRMAVLATESMYLFYRKHYTRLAILGAMLIFRTAAAARFLRDLVRWMWLALINVEDEQRRALVEDLRIWTRVIRLRPSLLTPTSINHPDRSGEGNRDQSQG